MNLTIDIQGKIFTCDFSQAFDASIPIRFDAPQVSAFGIRPATAPAFEGSGWVGDTRRGGSCNFEEVRFVPHCNGTHTEGIGHLTHERLSVLDAIPLTPIVCALTSVAPKGNEITASDVRNALQNLKTTLPKAIAIRTLPNPTTKLSRNYLREPAPYLSVECATWFRTSGVEHLLTDLPSLDPEKDEGRLAAHRAFFDLEPAARSKTVTELAYFPNEAKDGLYLLNLCVPRLELEAMSTRPLLYPLKEV